MCNTFIRSLILVGSSGLVFAGFTRTISVETLTEKSCLKIYPSGTEVVFRVKGGEGESSANDKLSWRVADWQGKDVLSGTVSFGEKEWTSGVEVKIDGRRLSAGCFFFYPSLTSDGATVPAVMSRPEGFEAFGLLPNLQAVPIESTDRSRFGMQGTAWLFDEIGVWPAYDVLGVKWVYGNVKPVTVRPTKESVYEPQTEAEHLKSRSWDYYGRYGYSVLSNMHGVPAWMLKLPDNLKPEEVNKDITRHAQGYPLKEPAAYKEVVGKLMLNESRVRKIKRPYMSRSWYELHWEPDWHWHGTEDEFIEYYRLAREAMDQNDPTACLMAANYGVIDVGTKKLESLFKKGIGRYINAVSTHTYVIRDNKENGGNWPEGAGIDLELRKLRQMTDQYLGKDAPLLQTESGLHFDTTKPYHDALVEHAERVIRSHLIALGEGCNTTFFFYLGDHEDNRKWSPKKRISYGLCFNEDTTGRFFGPRNIAPKPTGMAAAALTRLLEGTRTIGRLDNFGAGVYAYAFRRAEEYLVAAWTTNSTPRTVRMNVGKVALSKFDFMGNRERVNPDKDGTLNLELTTTPIYLLGVAPEEVKAYRKQTLGLVSYGQ